MRSSFVSLTCAAGALVMVLAYAAESAATSAGPECCGDPEESKPAAPGGGEASGGGVGAEAATRPVQPALTSGAFTRAYADAFAILNAENSCSRFFGGPRLAVTALNALALQLRSRQLGEGPVGLRMSGRVAIYRDTATGETYRLFDEAYLNRGGPFYARVAREGAPRMMIGRFPAESRQAKALLLLHELGHLVAAPGGEWVLPDDGGDPRQSGRNTEAVESQCRKQLLALG